MATNESAGPLSSKRSKTRATALREFLRGLFRILRANPLTLIGFILVVIISVTAALVVLVPAVTQVVLGHPVLFTPYDPNGLSTEYGQAPSGSHLLGTDNLGRDMFSRILAASRSIWQSGSGSRDSRSSSEADSAWSRVTGTTRGPSEASSPWSSCG